MTKHHVFPKRWRELWTGREKREKIIVCRKCHDGIEEEIHEREKANGFQPLAREEYLEIAKVPIAATKAA